MVARARAKIDDDMLQVKEFTTTKTILFDGESGLRSKNVQKEIYHRFKIKIHAEPYFKRNMAERGIREIKLRLALLLSLESKIKKNLVRLL